MEILHFHTSFHKTDKNENNTSKKIHKIQCEKNNDSRSDEFPSLSNNCEQFWK